MLTMKIESRKIAIDKLFKRRSRYEIPDWQRGEVWDTAKKQELIDSILRGWKLPKFYFLRTSDEIDEFEVVDGQQRLQAIWDFFENSIPLSEESKKEYKASYYKDLGDVLSDKFDDFEIEFDEISEATDEEVKEFFQRLQQGLPLTGSERLNAVHSNLRDYCRTLADHTFFIDKVAFTDKRYSYFDVVAKVVCVEIEGLNSGLRFDEVKEVFESHKAFSEKSAIAKHLNTTFDYLARVFPQNSKELRNRSMTQSIATLASRLVKTEHSKGSEKDFYDFVKEFVKSLLEQTELGSDATDEDYTLFQSSVSANIRGAAKIRHEVLIRKMLQISPQLTGLFEPTIVTESGISKKIQRISQLISVLINKINTAYSHKNGEDLFKATNKTVMALTQIGKTIHSFPSYKEFIENLYFLFWESHGSKLVSTKPQSFIDLNSLRTDLRHDLDHGKEKSVRAKRKIISQVFKKYSGDISPITIAPNLFPVFQINLLTAIEKDLSYVFRTIK